MTLRLSLIWVTLNNHFTSFDLFIQHISIYMYIFQIFIGKDKYISPTHHHKAGTQIRYAQDIQAIL